MRFYENIFKPIPIFIFALGIVIINPFQIPPDPVAKANVVISAPPAIERSPEAAKVYAQSKLNLYKWDKPAEWECLLALWTKESNWRPDAYNKKPVYQGKEKLHAGGIPQILGLDPDLSVEEQVMRGLIYIEHRYSNPCSAWRFWERNFWY